MKKEVKKKKATLDSLATMVENLAISTAKGFERVDKRFEDIEKRMATKDDIQELKHKLDGTNRRIDDLAFNKVGYDVYSQLAVRVDKIEKKLAIKK